MEKTKNFKKGFTLIELLAVIVILAVIALIAVPVITTIINDAEMNSILNSMRNLVDAGEKYYARVGYTNTECIDVNSSELDFKNNLGDILGKVCYDGNEAYLNNVIYENYVINGTVDKLVYSMIDGGKDPVYVLEDVTFDGVDDYYDTGYALFDTTKNFTFVISVTSESTHVMVNPPTILHCMLEDRSSNYPGFVFDHQWVNGRIAGVKTIEPLFYQAMKDNKNILVVKRDVRTEKFTYYVFTETGEIKATNYENSTQNFDKNLLVGAYQSTAGVKGRFFKGTVHYFSLYMTALDDETIENIMMGLNS